MLPKLMTLRLGRLRQIKNSLDFASACGLQQDGVFFLLEECICGRRAE
jgi:hypothetical protein